MDGNTIGEQLIVWYEANKRDLPWRTTTDPYLIWISEIILQQTRVIQGLDYFNRFVTRFPDVKSLADAQEDEVMKFWQGLGYYSRARNLHVAAREVVLRFKGCFPEKYEDVLSLPGIGAYTAAAICSFAYKQPYAVLDGNVFRVLARVFGIDMPIDNGKGKKYFAELAQELLDNRRPDLYNQAIMDFGAVQCLPKSPDCKVCPLLDKCFAFADGQIDKLPMKEGKTVVKARYFNYLHICCRGEVLLGQRTAKDIWQKLYEFPLIETNQPVDYEELQQTELFKRLFEGVGEIRVIRMVRAPKHVLSHRIIYACFYEIETDAFVSGMSSYLKVRKCDVENYAVSRLMEQYLENLP